MRANRGRPGTRCPTHRVLCDEWDFVTHKKSIAKLTKSATQAIKIPPRALGVSVVDWLEFHFTSTAVAFSIPTPLGRSVTQSVCTRSHP